MSILHSRIVQHGGDHRQAQAAAKGFHPYGTPQTPMVMPHHEVMLTAGTGLYQDLYPVQPATGDVNAVPFAALAPGSFGTVHPAGRP